MDAEGHSEQLLSLLHEATLLLAGGQRVKWVTDERGQLVGFQLELELDDSQRKVCCA